MLGGLHFEGRQKKATPSPMCAIHFCIGYSSSVAQFYREKIKYTNIANKFLETNGYLDFIHWDTFSHYSVFVKYWYYDIIVVQLAYVGDLNPMFF